MKRFGLLLIFFLPILTIQAQYGWRPGEMEANVFIRNAQDKISFQSLKLNADLASPDGTVLRVYVTPSETEKIKNAGLDYRITIPDLNQHSRDVLNSDDIRGYYNYTTINALADSLATAYPAICQKVLLGSSAGGRQIATLKISDNVTTNENEPEILFEGGIHGDELMGPEVVIRYARDLCKGYGTDPEITDMVNTREIWLFYHVNPDGYVNVSRYNENGVDINRDCGYMWGGEGNSPSAFSQPESKIVRDLQLAHNPVVFTCYHGGTEIISFPWSYKTNAPADYAHINNLAGLYSSTSGYPSLPYGQGYNVMYQIFGSTKDNIYGSIGQAGWSIEITNQKQPSASMIATYYGYNKPAVTEMIQRAGDGVEGLVTDSITGAPVMATVWVDGFFPVYTDPQVGDYHKYLLPGNHSIKVTANGYRTKTISGITVPSTGSVVTNFQLVPGGAKYAYRVVSSEIPYYPGSGTYPDESYTPGVLGSPDSATYSLGKSGWVIIDMGDTIFNHEGDDFRIWESGGTPEGYTVYTGATMDGPWISLGAATGTKSFDLSVNSCSKTRYLKLIDDGDGSISQADAGFDLDAIEILNPMLVAGFTASDSVICTGESVDFTDQTTGNPISWAWSFPGGTPGSSSVQNPAGIRYDVAGSYEVTLIVSDGISTDTIIKPAFITVTDSPVVFLGSDTLVCLPNSFLLDAGNPGSSYLWSTGETTQTIYAITNGTGILTYSVQVTNEQGCTGNDTIVLSFVICDAIPELPCDRISVCPNPSSGIFTVTGTTDVIQHYTVFNELGIPVVKGQTPKGRTWEIDLRGFPDGVYFLQTESSGSVASAKLVLKR